MGPLFFKKVHPGHNPSIFMSTGQKDLAKSLQVDVMRLTIQGFCQCLHRKAQRKIKALFCAICGSKINGQSLNVYRKKTPSALSLMEGRHSTPYRAGPRRRGFFLTSQAATGVTRTYQASISSDRVPSAICWSFV